MKSLKALKLIVTRLHPSPDNVAKAMHEVKIVEKSLKALEIIKMKNVDIPMAKTCNSVNDYNEWHSQYKEMHLTQQEYDLLKEILQ